MSYQLLMNDGNTLIHYGVLGMKWGVRHDREKAAYKSLRKLNRLDRRLTKMKNRIPRAKKYEFKAAKYELKAARAQARGNTEKYNKYHSKALRKRKRSARAEYRAAKAQHKVEKWANRMIKEFGDKPLSYIDSDQMALGKKYMIQAIENSKTNPRNWKNRANI